jgi:uncharacterized protein (TIGR03437 family)
MADSFGGKVSQINAGVTPSSIGQPIAATFMDAMQTLSMTRKHAVCGAFCHNLCRFSVQLLFLALPASAANPSIALRVSSETAPPGGYAQFKVFVTSPTLISSASITMTFDPAIFGSTPTVAGFSATGDQTGFYGVQESQFTAYVTSTSASIGQLPDLPVFVVTVPVLATAKIGATSSINFDPTKYSWQDQSKNTYSVSVSPGTFTVGGNLSIQSVTPGGGLLPSGTVVSIDGTGFDATTAVAIDGVSIASTELVSAQQINVTLGGATEMAAKHVHVSNANASVDYFSALASEGLILPLLPMLPYTAVTWNYSHGSVFFTAYECLQNSNAFPVTVNYYFVNSAGQLSSQSVVIPPYGLYLGPPPTLSITLGGLYMTVSAPIRMTTLNMGFAEISGPPSFSVSPPMQLTKLGALGPATTGGEFIWNWQISTAAPQPQTVMTFSAFPFTVSLSGGAEAWLQVTPMSGAGGTTLTLTPIVSKLGAGTYTGTVIVTPQLPPDLAQLGFGSVSYPVTINVNAQPTLVYTSGDVVFSTNPGGLAPITVSIASNGTPAAFTTTIVGASWFSVTPSSGTAPASLTITANTAGLSPGNYYADLFIKGPINTIDVPVSLAIGSGGGLLQVSPTSLTFSLVAGQGAPSKPQTVAVITGTPVSVTSSTQTGGNWLTASVTNQFLVEVNATAASLGPGTYLGTLTISTTPGHVATVPVTLTVIAQSGPGQLTVSPSSLTLTAPAGTSVSGTLSVTSSGGVPYFTIQGAAGTLGASLTITPPSTTGQYSAPATIQVTANPSAPATYQESLVIAWNGGSATIPIALYATASASAPPMVSAIVGSGSAVPSSIAPGELISIFGEGLGGAPTSLMLDSSGKFVTNLGGTQVSINGIAAPMIYASTGQVNAMVPYEAGTGTATVQVTAAGIQAGAWAVPIAPAAPSIFTVSGGGVGQGAVVNADGTVNSVANPAMRGSAIQIYATGGGQTSPASTTGGVAQGVANLTLPVTVMIGGVNVQVLYAGSAPGEVEGVVQINAIVPQDLMPGAVPIVVSVGGVPSQASVTLAVE